METMRYHLCCSRQTCMSVCDTSKAARYSCTQSTKYCYDGPLSYVTSSAKFAQRTLCDGWVTGKDPPQRHTSRVICVFNSPSFPPHLAHNINFTPSHLEHNISFTESNQLKPCSHHRASAKRPSQPLAASPLMIQDPLRCEHIVWCTCVLLSSVCHAGTWCSCFPTRLDSRGQQERYPRKRVAS